MNVLHKLSGGAATTINDAISQASAPEELHQLACRIWQGNVDGLINDDDANHLQERIDRRRGNQLKARPMHARASRFTPRRRPRSPDREESRQRRRMIGGSGFMPPKMRCLYTEGERAVLFIIAGEVKHHGVCDLPIDKIAALAGVCRTTVQTAQHEARLQGHLRITERPRPGQKNLTNVVEITSKEWLGWIKRGPVPHYPIGSNLLSPSNLVSTTKNKDSTREESEPDGRAARGPPRGADGNR